MDENSVKILSWFRYLAKQNIGGLYTGTLKQFIFAVTDLLLIWKKVYGKKKNASLSKLIELFMDAKLAHVELRVEYHVYIFI